MTAMNDAVDHFDTVYEPLADGDADEATEMVAAHCENAARQVASWWATLAELTAGELAETRARQFAAEATASSHIENESLGVTWQMLIRERAGRLADDDGCDAGMVPAAEPPPDHVAALRCESSTERLMRSTCTARALTAAHRLLLPDQPHKRPGEFRPNRVNMVIGNGYRIVYRAPRGGPAVRRMMNELCAWSSQQAKTVYGETTASGQWKRDVDGSPPQDLIRSAAAAIAISGVAHLRFESVHPFCDGNGRTGRGFAERLLAAPLPPRFRFPLAIGTAFSDGMARQSYYDALTDGRGPGGQDRFVRWWASRAAEAAGTAQARTAKPT